MLVLAKRAVKLSGMVLRTLLRSLSQRNQMVAAVGFEKDKQSTLQTKSIVFSTANKVHNTVILDDGQNWESSTDFVVRR